jgi:hypothetical protein
VPSVDRIPGEEGIPGVPVEVEGIPGVPVEIPGMPDAPVDIPGVPGDTGPRVKFLKEESSSPTSPTFLAVLMKDQKDMDPTRTKGRLVKKQQVIAPNAWDSCATTRRDLVETEPNTHNPHATDKGLAARCMNARKPQNGQFYSSNDTEPKVDTADDTEPENVDEVVDNTNSKVTDADDESDSVYEAIDETPGVGANQRVDANQEVPEDTTGVPPGVPVQEVHDNQEVPGIPGGTPGVGATHGGPPGVPVGTSAQHMYPARMAPSTASA